MHAHRRAAISLATCLLIAAELGTSSLAHGESDARTPSARPAHAAARMSVLDRAGLRSVATPASREDTTPLTSFLGIDGLLYPLAAPVVPGLDQTYFMGEDFDAACAIGGKGLKTGLKELGDLAKIIRRSGREVVFTAAPNKSSAETQDLASPLPHGDCDTIGLSQQNDVLDHFKDPNYLPVRRGVSKVQDGFWRTDAHWNSLGATEFAEQVARRFSPQVVKLQKYRRELRTWVGDMATHIQPPVVESVEAKVPDNGVKTRTLAGSEGFDPLYSYISDDHSWVSRPARKTIPGQTLFLGDSFTYTALEPLRNMFRHGRFLWIAFEPYQKLISAINDSDRVVITLVQRYATMSNVETQVFKSELRAGITRVKPGHAG